MICIHCSSFFYVTDALLCPTCLRAARQFTRSDDLVDIHLSSVRNPKPDLQFLFYWEPWKSDLISRLLYALKGPQQKSAWRFWAQDFVVSQNLAAKMKSMDALLIPCPSQDGETQDHAGHFAHNLGDLLGLPVFPVLRRTPSLAAQKDNPKFLRQKKTLEVYENFSPWKQRLLKGKTLVFVDDILTTGSTAQAAYQALGSPREFFVWVLAMRGLLEGSGRQCYR